MKVSLIEQLPPELIMEIRDHLSTVDRILLALTNKHMYSLIHNKQSFNRYNLRNNRPTRFNVSDKERFELLAVLSRTKPGMFACYACLKLHLFVKEWTMEKYTAHYYTMPFPKACIRGGHPSRLQKKKITQSRSSTSLNAVYLFMRHSLLDFHIPYLVMNKHFFPNGNGLNLSALIGELYCPDVFATGMIKYRARIIGDELYLISDMRIQYVETPDPNTQPGWPIPVTSTYCIHSHAHREHTTVRNTRNVIIRTEACRICYTDIESRTTTLDPVKGRCELETTAVTCLGSCRSQDDPKWESYQRRQWFIRSGGLRPQETRGMLLRIVRRRCLVRRIQESYSHPVKRSKLKY